jgi:transposase InsO family protein
MCGGSGVLTGRERIRVLRPGMRVKAEGVTFTVAGIEGTHVCLVDVSGRPVVLGLAELMARSGFAVEGVGAMGPVLGGLGVLGRVEPEVVERAEWWERHVREVIDGLAPDAPAGTVPRPGYDPGATTVSAREALKARELAAAGAAVTVHQVKRQRQRYQAGGLPALISRREVKSADGLSRADPRVIEAIRVAIAEAEEASSRTGAFVLWRAGVILSERFADDGDPPRMPSRPTGYRWLRALSAGKHTTGSAVTRRSLANRPPTAFRTRRAAAPGEVVQIDSTPLDVLVDLGEGVSGRVELTGMIDVATRSVVAAVLRPSTKAVDACLLLARALTPEPMRPGWSRALAMAASALPYRRMVELDQRLKDAAARPVICPDTIVFDQGAVFISRAFKTACAALGITYQPAHPGTPTERGQIERMMGSVGTLFAQYVAGYTGSNPTRRGYRIEAGALWSLPELQALLDEWIVCWHHRPHEGLRDPHTPSRILTPLQMYAALIEAAGYVPLALSGEDYLELLPVCWRAIHAYGIRIAQRTYDTAELASIRHQPSGIAVHKGRWEVRYDPYDVTRIWVREHRAGRWITVFWTQLHRVAEPFGELVWDHARAGQPGAGEAQVADAVEDLLRRAHRGPEKTVAADARERRVAARTRVTAGPVWPRPEPPAQPAEPAGADAEEIVAFELFDPYQEAQRRW